MSWKLSTLVIGLLNFLASSVMAGGQEQDPGPANGSPVAASGDTSPPAAAQQTDKELIEKQKTCPVSDQPLGSMGEPVKVVVEGRTVFLCCAGCKPKLLAAPDKYLKALDEKKSQLPGAARAAEDMKGAQHPLPLQHITTQAEAEALKPGDSISMVCSMCKNVVVMPVTTGKEHVNLMTVGQKHTCADCGGIVTVVGTGKGEGKNEDVKHVCAKCGDNAMFVCATKAGSGAMKDMDAAEHVKGAQHPLPLQHITTQAEAEALKPGDSISMVCSMCKNVVVMPVTTGKEHVKLMTIGQKHTCADCGGTVTVVGTGKGEGKNEDVKHVCAKCGDNAMFVCASKPGSGASKHHEEDKK